RASDLLDLTVVARNAPLIVAGVLAMMIVKGLCIYGTARLARSSPAEALDRAVLMAQGGEFAFVLFSAALANGVIDPAVNANMTAIVVLSMALTPLAVIAHKRWAPRAGASAEGLETPHDQVGRALVIGFGRVGQIASQHMLALGAEITIIDNDPEMIRSAAEFGFKVYYGDGTRTDVLHAAGARHAQAILVCANGTTTVTQMVERIKAVCPHSKVLARAFDRERALALHKADVDYQVRETFESAMMLGRQATLALGATSEASDEIADEIRRRDAERFQLEVTGGLFAGRALLLNNQSAEPRQ